MATSESSLNSSVANDRLCFCSHDEMSKYIPCAASGLILDIFSLSLLLIGC